MLGWRETVAAVGGASGFVDEEVLANLEKQVGEQRTSFGKAFRQLAQLVSEKHVARKEAESVAARLVLEGIRSETPATFTGAVQTLYDNVDPSGKHRPIVSKALRDYVSANGAALDALADEFASHDHGLSVFALSTLEKAYLLRNADGLVERPCYLYLRVAVALNDSNDPDCLAAIRRLYELLVTRRCSFATPVLFNAGCAKNPNLASCFLYTVPKEKDTIDGIFSSLRDCANISHMSGGIGISLHDVRCRGSPINGGAGKAQGLLPVMRLYDVMAQTVDQGGGKRRGSIAVYLEPHHPDFFEFLESRMTYGDQAARTHDLFIAVWASDLFMKRVEADAEWSFFCPNLAPGLSDVWGDDYEALYTKYEAEGRAFKTMPARAVFYKIIDSQMNSSLPYMLYKDHCNAKSNQQNLGTIRSMNLCCETLLYSSADETAVCILASVCLPKCIADAAAASWRTGFDFRALHAVAYTTATALDRVIDVSAYPIESARRSSLRHRPIGVGVQGLADCFASFGLVWGTAEAFEFDEAVHATLYHAALEASADLAEIHGAYESFAGSPTSEGKLQFDLWNEAPYDLSFVLPDALPWPELRRRAQRGLRNSVSVALMPTASTAQIAGNSECVEPYTANLFTRGTLSGEFVVVNPALRAALERKGAWTTETINEIIREQGSVQSLGCLTDDEKAVFQTAWQMKQKHVLEHAALRSRYVCQSTSMNIHMRNPTREKLTSLHFHAWKLGLKTSSYYIRMESTASALQFAVKDSAPPACESCSA